MIGIIKIALVIYLIMGIVYFIFTGKKNLFYLIKHTPTLWGKIRNAVWIIGFSFLMGGFLVMKWFYIVGRKFSTLYQAYRKFKKLNKKLKK